MTTIIIPARFASTRYPGKPLAVLTGKDGVKKPLIQWTWEVGVSVSNISNVFVATDNILIADTVKDFGGKVIMTSEKCRNGTERCAEAIINERISDDLIVNLQGDAPLTPKSFLEKLISSMEADEGIDVATPVLRCDAEALSNFKEDRKHDRVGGTTAVFDSNMNGLYFSKEVIPYTGALNQELYQFTPVFHHVGVYAYRDRALKQYASWPEGKLERLEGLEQLRFLENGSKLRCVEVKADGAKFWELNNPSDIDLIEKILQI